MSPNLIWTSVYDLGIRVYLYDIKFECLQEIVSITPKTLGINGISYFGVLLQAIYQMTKKRQFWVRRGIKGAFATGPGCCITVYSDPWAIWLSTFDGGAVEGLGSLS